MEKENKIYLSILGFKKFSDGLLLEIFNELEKINVDYGNLLYEPFSIFKRKIKIEQNRRKNSKCVWVEFVAYWSGYTSKQRREVGRYYHKITREDAKKLPSFYKHHFSDNTTNDWYIKVVSVRGKDSGSYSDQIDEIIKDLS